MDEESKSEKSEWYAIHTYSGYENKVKANIEKIVENRNMQDLIDQVVIPLQEVMEMKNGKKKMVMKKVFPGYVLIKMIMNDDTWYVVRNTRGVTSFVGPGSKPVALTEAEVASMGVDSGKVFPDLEKGQSVKIIAGAFEGSIGNVEELNFPKNTVKIKLSIFGRDTFMELDCNMVQKI